VWLGVMPIIIGVIFEFAILLPLRCPINESPYFFVFHDWALGLLYLKVWFRIVMLDAYPNSWKQKFEKIRTDGIVGVQMIEIIRQVLLPIMTPILTVLTLPYAVCRGIIPLLIRK
jgi:E3 ubiquitin-protein ligase MARCH6